MTAAAEVPAAGGRPCTCERLHARGCWCRPGLAMTRSCVPCLPASMADEIERNGWRPWYAAEATRDRARALIAAHKEPAMPEPIRDLLAEALNDALKRLDREELPHEVAVRDDDGVLYWDELDMSEYLGLTLLPVVQAYADRQAAEALLDAADELLREDLRPKWAARLLRARAAALNPNGDPR